VPAPSVADIKRAAARLQGLRGNELEVLQRDQVGDPLLAGFAVLARKVFPDDAEAATVRRVRLMVASYLLRGDVERTVVRAPTEPEALAAVQAVGALSGAALGERIDAELGHALVTWFSGFAAQLMPEGDPRALPGKVHLMTLAWLARGELA
jgi:hypothetical protein